MQDPVIALLGAVAVAIITTAAQWALHHRDQRGAKAQWHADRRFPAYVEFLATATELSALIGNHANLLASGSRLRPWEPLVGMWLTRHIPRLHGAWASLTKSQAEIRLLGTSDVVAAAEETLATIEQELSSVTRHGRAQGTAGLPDDRARRIGFAIERMRDACRHELGQATLEALSAPRGSGYSLP
ncbi:hypothetical protein [Egicoccus sp. AB-alg2]|uniref:hypothetical protein n=1 Tax=Egicoccus sp. AB-alg2 TaxID=3242693 RepID=UPI00359DD5DC